METAKGMRDMAKLYAMDERLLTEKPEIRIGDRVYAVDNRMRTFEAMNGALNEPGGNGREFEIVLRHALGEKAYEEISDMDLSFPAMHRVVVLIMAAMQDITEEQAESRFQNAGQ